MNDRINGAVRVALRQPEIRDKLVAVGIAAVDVSVEQFDKLVRAELVKWDKVVKPLGITPIHYKYMF